MAGTSLLSEFLTTVARIRVQRQPASRVVPGFQTNEEVPSLHPQIRRALISATKLLQCIGVEVEHEARFKLVLH